MVGVRDDRAWWVRSQPLSSDGLLGRRSSEGGGAASEAMVSARRGCSARTWLKQVCSRGIYCGSSARAHLNERHGHGDGRARQLGRRGAQHRAGRGEGRRRRHEGEEELQNGHQAVMASGWLSSRCSQAPGGNSGRLPGAEPLFFYKQILACINKTFKNGFLYH